MFDSHIQSGRTFFKVLFLMQLLVSAVSGAWKTELIDCDADERLNAVITHSSGNIIAIGDEMTVVFSEDSGRSWDESKLPDIKGWANEDEDLLSSIKEIPGSGELLMTLVQNDVEQTNTGGPDFERRTAIFSSNDGGKSWKVLSKISNAALYWIFVFSDGQCIFLGASNFIYEYKNGIVQKKGENPLADEEMITTLRIQYYAKIRFDGSVTIKQHGDDLFLKNENGFYVSKDKGQSWDLVKQFHTEISINSISIFNNNSIIAGCDNGLILFWDNQGNCKTSVTISKKDINDICVSSQCNWWISGDEGFLAFSNDQGKSWFKIKTTCEEDLYSIMVDPSCDEVWICGDKGGLMHVYNNQLTHSLTSDEDDLEATVDSSLVTFDRKNNFKIIDDQDSLLQGLTLSVAPDNCTITTGKHIYRGSSFKIQLPVGEHIFQISKAGYFSKTEKYRINKGEVEDDEISLRKIQVLIAPSGGLFARSPEFGINFSLLSGVVGFNNNAAGLEFNADIYIGNPFDIISFSAFYGRKIILSESFSFFPSISIGGSIIQETKTEQAESDYASETITYVNKGAPFIHTSTDFILKKNDRWGYLLRPSLAWIGNWGMQFYIRFGGIVWI